MVPTNAILVIIALKRAKSILNGVYLVEMATERGILVSIAIASAILV